MTVALTIAALLVLAALTATIQGRRCAPPESVYVDECETCGRQLTAGEVHELRSDADDDEELLEGHTFGGGTYMSATYCAEHYPKENT